MDIASLLMNSAGLLTKILGSPIAKEIQSIWKYEADIKRFKDTVGYVGDVLSDMERRHIQEASVKTAYKRLREAFLDAEDFLDAVETHRKKQEAIATKLNKARRIFTVPNKAKHAVKVHKAIDEMRKNLDDIANDLHKFQPNFTLEATDRMTNIRATGTCVDAAKMIGREDDKRNIIDLLLRSSDDPLNIPVISIVGMGGMGKTTTAQLLYNDKSWQNSCGFDLKLWVSDSKKFDVKSVLKKIVRSTTDDENGLREQLVEKIGGKRFLLVLDDVENEDHLIWEQLQDLLNQGNKEDSRILVTTRSKEVARIMGSDSAYELRGLSEIDALQLFERYAFRARRDENLVEIGKLVAKKCLGVPLAIKVIGSLLCGKDRYMWERVRDTDLAIKEENDQHIIPILKLSYYNLDSTLKQCFSYCALFPKNFLITNHSLSSVWKANVRFKLESETLEDDCEKNLKTLCDRCLLVAEQQLNWDIFGHKGWFIMHDLIHDLASEVAGDEMFVVNSNAEVDSNKLVLKENVRHVSLFRKIIKVDGPSTFEVKGRRLRTFLTPRHPLYTIFVDTMPLDELVLDCPVLRLLNIHSWGVKRIPNSIGKLIHLRHLDLSGNRFETLPNSIVELINLRHLDVSDCWALTHLPSGMDALTSLEVLLICTCNKLEELSTGIEKLINLRQMDLSYSKMATSYMLSKMGSFASLEVLYMSRSIKFEEHLVGIEKHIKLRRLTLSGCVSLTRLPSGMGALTSLEMLNLSFCSNLVELPVSIEKLIKLRHLDLCKCEALSHLPSGMGALTSLEMLNLSWCSKLKELPMGVVKLRNLKVLNLEGCNALTHMPSGMGSLPTCTLSRYIVGDPESKHTAQLEELGRLSESIGEKLIIELPNNMTLKESWDGEAFLLDMKRLWSLVIEWQDSPKEEVPMNHMEILAKLQPPPNLTDFELYGYQGKTFPPWFPTEDFASILPNLKEIWISNCGNCKHLPPLSGLRCLESLTLRGLSNLEYIEENISAATLCRSLVSLTLEDLPELKGWCRGLATGVDDDGEHEHSLSLMLPSFPRLYHLGIGSCPNLTVAPILVSSVKVFSIESHDEREETESHDEREETLSSASSSSPLPLSSSSVALLVQVCSDGGGFTYDSGYFNPLIISGWNASDNPSIHMDESFREMSEDLYKLEFNNCSGLKTLPAGVEHLTALSRLEIKQCREFTAGEDGEMPWKDLQSLTDLTFSELPKMVALPEGIQFITSLRKLQIEHCDNLLLPEWLHKNFKHEKLSSVDRFER